LQDFYPSQMDKDNKHWTEFNSDDNRKGSGLSSPKYSSLEFKKQGIIAETNQIPCQFYQFGQCTKGNTCPFLHKALPQFSPQLCKFFANGYCRNSDRCPFLHVKPGESFSSEAANATTANNPLIFSNSFLQHESPTAPSIDNSFHYLLDRNIQSYTISADITNNVVPLHDVSNIYSPQDCAVLDTDNSQVFLNNPTVHEFNEPVVSVLKNPLPSSHFSLFEDIWNRTSASLSNSSVDPSSELIPISSVSQLSVPRTQPSTMTLQTTSPVPASVVSDNDLQQHLPSSYSPHILHTSNNTLINNSHMLKTTTMTKFPYEEQGEDDDRNYAPIDNYTDNNIFLTSNTKFQVSSLNAVKMLPSSNFSTSSDVLSPSSPEKLDYIVNESSESNEIDELPFLQNFELVLGKFEEESSLQPPSHTAAQNNLYSQPFDIVVQSPGIQHVQYTQSTSSSDTVVNSASHLFPSPSHRLEPNNNLLHATILSSKNANVNESNILSLNNNNNNNNNNGIVANEIVNDKNNYDNNNNTNKNNTNPKDLKELIIAAEILQNHSAVPVQYVGNETNYNCERENSVETLPTKSSSFLSSTQQSAVIMSRESEPSLSLFSSSSQAKKSRQQLCTFYMEGKCRYGDACRNIHGNVCNICLKATLIPNDSEQNKSHITECLQRQKLLKELENSKDYECGICHEKIMENGRKFGILTSCLHTFCVGCVKAWRQEHQSNECPNPQCGTTSPFIIPSSTFILDPAKKALIIDLYKVSTSTFSPTNYC
jgi:hypothetical protein